MAYTHDEKGPGNLIRSADWNDMGRETQRLGEAKVDRAGDTIAQLSVRTGLEVGTANAGAPLRIYKRQEDGSALEHGALIVGSDAPTSASLRLGYGPGYSWLQGQGRQALALNPRGGDVGVGTDAPRSRLSVAGGLSVGAGYAAGAAAPAGTLLVEGSLGIGTPSPRTALDTGNGVMSGAANDYLQGQLTMSGGGTVSWGGPGGRLKWTSRFIAIPVGRPGTSGSGYVNIVMPTTELSAAQVWNGQARSATVDGVVLNGWEALYAVHATGQGEGAVTYRIVTHTADFSAPSNWLLVAAVNGDDGTVRLGTGEIVGRGGTLQRRLDVAENGAATVRAADFNLGHSTRRGTPGRALVDNTRQLVINYGGDWPDGVQVGGALSVTGPLSFGSATRQMVNLWGTQYGIGVQGSTTYFRSDSHFAFYRGGAHSDAALNAGGGTALLAIRDNGNVGMGVTEPAAKLEVNGAALVGNGSNFANRSQFMPAGSLTVGGTDKSFGGGSGWTGNTAGLLLETQANTEIAVHDAGTRVASLMYYEGEGANRITVGRDMGWGPVARVVVSADLEVRGTLRAARTSPMVHRMYPADALVYQDIFDARNAGAFRKFGAPSYDDTSYAVNSWYERRLVKFGTNNEADANGVEVVIPAGYDTVWVRVLGDRWASFRAFFRDGSREDLGVWTGGYRSNNGYGPDGSLSDGFNDPTHAIEGGSKLRVDLHQWVPVPAGRSGTLALVAKPNTNWEFWVSGLAFSRNPWGHAGQSAVGYHWAVNGGNNMRWNTHDWNQDVLAEIPQAAVSELMVPTVPTGRDRLLYLVEHNNNWNGTMHNGITVNGRPVERFLSTYSNPFARHWNGKYFERYIAARIPAEVMGAERYLRVRIDMTKQNSPIYFREIGTHDLETPLG